MESGYACSDARGSTVESIPMHPETKTDIKISIASEKDLALTTNSIFLTNDKKYFPLVIVWISEVKNVSLHQG